MRCAATLYGHQLHIPVLRDSSRHDIHAGNTGSPAQATAAGRKSTYSFTRYRPAAHSVDFAVVTLRLPDAVFHFVRHAITVSYRAGGQTLHRFSMIFATHGKFAAL